MDDLTVIAVDWSGARSRAAQRRGIWVAVVRDGTLVESRNGWTREQAVELVANTPAPVYAGFDFSFGVPEWFALEHGCRTVDEVWALAAREGDRWLRTPMPPFWRYRCNVVPERRFRACEEQLRARGYAPKSIFQLVGNGQVGAGSVRGMPLLRELRAAGFAIWPFDAPGERTVLEVYPSTLGAKGTDREDAERAARTMWHDRTEIARLAPAIGAVERLEGDVWLPAAFRDT